MLRRLPALLARAARLGRQASLRDTVLAVALTVTGGLFTALGVLATSNVAAALLTAGPTAERVRAALPSLIAVAAALVGVVAAMVALFVVHPVLVPLVLIAVVPLGWKQGSHDELMAAGGRYAELFTLQASGYL